MQELKKRIERMLAGEQKRREVALQFLNIALEAIIPACIEIFGADGEWDNGVAGGTWLRTTSKSGFRLADGIVIWKSKTEQGKQRGWLPGFYFGVAQEDPEKLRGPDFWNGIREVVEFIDYIQERLDKQAESRESLVDKIREKFAVQ